MDLRRWWYGDPTRPTGPQPSRPAPWEQRRAAHVVLARISRWGLVAAGAILLVTAVWPGAAFDTPATVSVFALSLVVFPVSYFLARLADPRSIWRRSVQPDPRLFEGSGRASDLLLGGLAVVTVAGVVMHSLLEPDTSDHYVPLGISIVGFSLAWLANRRGIRDLERAAASQAG